MVVVPTALTHMYKTLNSRLILSKSIFKYNQNKVSLSVCLITLHSVKIIADSSVVYSMLLLNQILVSHGKVLLLSRDSQH